jgi:hypothetical protein
MRYAGRRNEHFIAGTSVLDLARRPAFRGHGDPLLRLAIALTQGLFQLFPVQSPAPRLMTMQFCRVRASGSCALYVMLRVRYRQPFWASLGLERALAGDAADRIHGSGSRRGRRRGSACC